MKKITIGVIGAGRIGKIHADNLLAMPGVRLKSVADPYLDPDDWSSRGIAPTLDPADVFNDSEIDAVLICSPTPTHAEFTEIAANAGKHVFCEKPIALDPDRIRGILRRDLKACAGCYVDITLKDVETVQHDPDRVRRWVQITREVIDELGM